MLIFTQLSGMAIEGWKATCAWIQSYNLHAFAADTEPNKFFDDI